MLLRTYFFAVPKETAAAARVDGATSWQVVSKVVLPIVSSGILTVALIISLYSWSEFLIATTFLQQQEHKLTAVVSFFFSAGNTPRTRAKLWLLSLLILPLVVLFAFL